MKVFVSYARGDKSYAQHLAEFISGLGYQAWYDLKLVPGQRWETVLKQQIESCDVFLPLLNDEFVTSKWCIWEQNVALQADKSLFPVVLQQDMIIPEVYQHIQAAKLTEPDNPNQLNKIAGGLSQLGHRKPAVRGPVITSSPVGLPARASLSESKSPTLSSHSISQHHPKSLQSKPAIEGEVESSYILAIDFGTSSSYCAYFKEGNPVIVLNQFGEEATPSAVYVNEDGSFEVGRNALNCIARDPENGMLQVKRLFGLGKRFHARGNVYSASELAAGVLKSLIRDFEVHIGLRQTTNDQREFDAVLTLPVDFTKVQTDDLREACRLANLHIKRLVAEPTAAAFLDIKKQNRVIAVCDLGAGTFDVSIVEFYCVEDEYTNEVLATAGNKSLGGADFDEVLVDYCFEQFKAQTTIDLSNNLKIRMRLREAAEQAKIELSVRESTIVHLPYFYADASGSFELTVPITRAKFQALTQQLVASIVECCKAALAICLEEEVNQLVLVGLASKMPHYQREMELLFQCEIASGFALDKSVAMGAAWQAGVLSGDAKDRLLIDATSHDFGVEVNGSEQLVLIKKSTTIPTKKYRGMEFEGGGANQIFVSVVQIPATDSEEIVVMSQILLDLQRSVPSIEITFETDADNDFFVKINDKEKSLLWSCNVTREPVFHPISDADLQRLPKCIEPDETSKDKEESDTQAPNLDKLLEE